MCTCRQNVVFSLVVAALCVAVLLYSVVLMQACYYNSIVQHQAKLYKLNACSKIHCEYPIALMLW
eukprot:14315-Heterococcus_DN1.PRE.1